MQIRESLRFRECSLTDAEKTVAWLVAHITQGEPSGERVGEHLSSHLREVKVEPQLRPSA